MDGWKTINISNLFSSRKKSVDSHMLTERVFAFYFLMLFVTVVCHYFLLYWDEDEFILVACVSFCLRERWEENAFPEENNQINLAWWKSLQNLIYLFDSQRTWKLVFLCNACFNFAHMMVIRIVSVLLCWHEMISWLLLHFPIHERVREVCEC